MSICNNILAKVKKERNSYLLILLFIILFLDTFTLFGQEGPVVHIDFNEIRIERRKAELVRGETYVPQEVFAYVRENIQRKEHELKGKYYKSVKGVSGKGVLFDGYTAHINIELYPEEEEEEDYISPLELDDAFSLDLWVALGAYPKNNTPLFDHRRDETHGRNEGYSFEIDAWGRPVVKVSSRDGRTETLIANSRIGLNSWYHLAATFSSKNGISIFINGEKVANQKFTGVFNPIQDAGDVPVLIGKSRVSIRPTGTIRGYGTKPSHTFIDGVFDELKLYKRCLNENEIIGIYNKYKTTEPPELPIRKLPSGPQSPGIFRAVNTTLEYYPGWDAPWAVDKNADVVVQFDESDCKFVFWRGTSYIPSWVTENGIHFNNGFNEGWNQHGSCEPMSDKKTKYSSVKIIESNRARVVVQWRYALVDVVGNFAFEDPETGWGDWTNETYYIYPDMTAVREDKLLSNAPNAEHEWQESMVVLGPGQKPEDVLEMKGLTVSNIDSEARTFDWENEDLPDIPQKPEKLCNQLVNTKSTYKPFSAIRPQDVSHMDIYSGEIRKDVSVYPWWNHWPVAPRPTDGRWANFSDRAAHASLSHWFWNEYTSDDRSMTKIMLCGLTNGNIDEVAKINKSWSNPANIKIISGGLNARYLAEEKAYYMEAKEDQISYELNGSKISPIHNPAFVIENWGENDTKVLINGEEMSVGKDLRIGTRNTIESIDLILWIKLSSTDNVQIEIMKL